MLNLRLKPHNYILIYIIESIEAVYCCRKLRKWYKKIITIIKIFKLKSCSNEKNSRFEGFVDRFILKIADKFINIMYDKDFNDL